MLKLGLIFGIVITILTGCSKEVSNDYMPITQENLTEYVKKMSVAAKNVSLDNDKIEKAIKMLKTPIEEMGYDFDATILHTIKVLYKAGHNALSVGVMEVFLSPTLLIIYENPELVVEKDFISENTRDKILMYHKFNGVTPEVVQALKYVKECQDNNNNICTVKQYVRIFLDNKFVTPKQDYKNKEEFKNLTVDDILNKQKNEAYYYQTMFNGKVLPSVFEKYIVHQDGKNINGIWFFSKDTKPFKFKEDVLKELDNFNPWWID